MLFTEICCLYLLLCFKTIIPTRSDARHIVLIKSWPCVVSPAVFKAVFDGHGQFNLAVVTVPATRRSNNHNSLSVSRAEEGGKKRKLTLS
jgi:hypothetical protein